MAIDFGNESPTLLLVDVVRVDQCPGREWARPEASHRDENRDVLGVDVLDPSDVRLSFASRRDVESQRHAGEQSLSHEGILTR
jgi:hypothetical protein